MFEDKRFKNENDNSNNFFMPDNSTGLREGNDNLNFGEKPEEITIRNSKKEGKPKNKIFLRLFLILLILSLIVGASFITYKAIFSNPYNVYKNVINYGFEYLDTKINNFNNKKLDYDLNKDIISTSGSFSLESNLLEKFKGYEFKYKLAMDLNKKEIDSNIIVNKDNQKLIDIESFIRDQKLILNSTDVYNKYLEIRSVENLSFNNLNIDNNILNSILKVIKETLIKDLDKNKMSIKNTTLNIENKNLKVINNIYKINREDTKKIYQDIIESLIENESIIDTLADIFNLRKSEVKDIFENLKTNEIVLNNLKDIEFNVYTSGITNKVIGGRILVENKEIINYTNYKNKLNIKSNTDNKINITKNNIETRIDFNDLLTLIITNKEDKTVYKFNIEIEKIEIEGNLEIELKRVANKKITTNILLDVKGKNDKEDFNLNLKFDNNTQVGGSITNIPKSNIVKYNDLNAYEKKEIENKLNDILTRLPFEFKEDSEINYCEIATDCECIGSICTCKYNDRFGLEQSINCLNKNI